MFKNFIRRVDDKMSNIQVDVRIERLKRRTQRCVCKYCGRELTLRHIVFSDINEAKVELYCDFCNRIEFGVEKEIYYSAYNFIDNLEFDYYENLDANGKKHQMNVAKICEIISWNCKNMGFLNQDGFTVPLNVEENAWSECLVLPSREVALQEEEEK